MSMQERARSVAKQVMPERFVVWYRRRRAVRRYLHALGRELFYQRSRIAEEEFEERVGMEHGGYEGLLKDLLDRMDLVLTALDRRIEGVAARHGSELRKLEDEVAALRAAVEELRTAGGGAEGRRGKASPHPADPAAEALPPPGKPASRTASEPA